MSTPSHINIVWLKRDLRLQDHEPLKNAEADQIPYLIIYIYEPHLLEHPDTSLRHLRFIHQSLVDLNSKLQPYNRQIQLLYGEAIEILNSISTQHKINTLFSYQESGTRITWQRDKAISKWCHQNGTQWIESQRDGIIRGISDRKDWAKNWYKTMHSDIIHNTYSSQQKELSIKGYKLPEKFTKELSQEDKGVQKGGTSYSLRYLNSFANIRGRDYHWKISKPTESRISCSRLSPYLAWGNLSIRQAYQYVYEHPNKKDYPRAYNGFLTRLRWHCHFIQKFEMECDYETRCINRGYESLARTKNDTYIEAWKKGHTGIPLVDACMRCVIETGWINFRMRAMLVSFLVHNLDQDWRTGVYHLAQQFLDYEPGIHYPQFQMQAGTTGVNTIRMYNPIKQSKDHDPDGLYIKKWIPELSQVPSQFVHEPWTMSTMEQSLYNCNLGKDYPYPIVDVESSAKIARDKVWGHRKNPIVKKESQRILRTHTIRRKTTD